LEHQQNFKTWWQTCCIFFNFILIANTFLSYIIGVETLATYITEPITNHLALLTGVLIFTFIFYVVYAFIREIVCTVICPYGRLQSVLTDKDTVVVAYDYNRGESRGRFKKNTDRTEAGLGDCIDCHQCVVVCPTGIDIRNGTQMECTNCTACIDACDFMMEKVGLPKGLIRYTSENNIAKGKKLTYTTRMKAYTVVLVLLLAFMSFLLITRDNIDAHIVRSSGQLYAEMGDNLANFYEIKIVNKTNETIPFSLQLEGINGELKMLGTDKVFNVESLKQKDAKFIILINKKDITTRKTAIKISILNKEGKVTTVKTNFLGPFK
jgi:cytochrome c oxidase accessory protein FixG